MPKRVKPSGDKGEPGEDPATKRSTRSSSKSPGAANPSKSSDPPLPMLPAKSAPKPPKPAPKPRGKGKKVTWEAKPEKWLENLPDNHGTYESKAFRMSKASVKYG